MAYKSLAQARKFHADPALRKYAAEWDYATQQAGGFKNLPERVGQKKKKRRHSRVAEGLMRR
jgi:hypothetical protein